MPGQRKEGKKLWGGYIDAAEIKALDAAAKARRFTTRTDFLSWIARNCESIPAPKSGSNGEAER